MVRLASTSAVSWLSPSPAGNVQAAATVVGVILDDLPCWGRCVPRSRQGRRRRAKVSLLEPRNREIEFPDIARRIRCYFLSRALSVKAKRHEICSVCRQGIGNESP